MWWIITLTLLALTLGALTRSALRAMREEYSDMYLVEDAIGADASPESE